MTTNTSTDTTWTPAIGDAVTFDGTIWTIESHAKGWWTLANDDGTRKARLAQLAPVDLTPESDEDEDEDEEEHRSQMASTLAKYRGGYLKTTNVTGRKTQICGDWLSQELTSLFPHEVALLADRTLDEGDGHHLARYSHLNDGQVRMNSGNRIRAAFRKLEQEEEREAFASFLQAQVQAIVEVRKADESEDEAA